MTFTLKGYLSNSFCCMPKQRQQSAFIRDHSRAHLKAKQDASALATVTLNTFSVRWAVSIYLPPGGLGDEDRDGRTPAQ